MNTGTNFKDVNDVMDAKEANNKTFLNFAMNDGDSLSLGAGYIHPFPEKITQILIKLAKEKKEKENSHHKQLQAIKDRIDDLRAEIKVLQAKIDELNEEKAENKDEITKNIKRMSELRAQGKEDSAEYLALLAANDALNDRNDDIDIEIQDNQDRIDDLEEQVDEAKARLGNSGAKSEQTAATQQILVQKDGNEIVNTAAIDTTIASASSIMEDKGYKEVDQVERFTGLSTTETVGAKVKYTKGTEDIVQRDSLEQMMAQANLASPQDTSVSYAKSGIEVTNVSPIFNKAAPLSVAKIDVTPSNAPDEVAPSAGLDIGTIG